MSYLSLSDLYFYSLEKPEFFDTHLLLEDETRQIEISAHRVVLDLSSLYFRNKSNFEKRAISVEGSKAERGKMIVPDAFSAYDLILSFYGIESNCGQREEWQRKIFKVLSQDYFQTLKGWEESYLDLCLVEIDSQRGFADLLLANRLLEQGMRIFEPSHDYSLAVNVVKNRGNIPLPPSYQAWIEEKKYVSEWKVAWMQGGLLHTYHPKTGERIESDYFSASLQGEEIPYARNLLSPDKETEVVLHRETRRVLVWDRKSMEWAIWQMDEDIGPKIESKSSNLLDCGVLIGGGKGYKISFNGGNIILYEENEGIEIFHPLNLGNVSKGDENEIKTYSGKLKGIANSFQCDYEHDYDWEDVNYMKKYIPYYREGEERDYFSLTVICPSADHNFLHFRCYSSVYQYSSCENEKFKGVTTIELLEERAIIKDLGYDKEYMITKNEVLVDCGPKVRFFSGVEGELSLGKATYDCEGFRVEASVKIPRKKESLFDEKHFDLSVTYRRKDFSAEGEKWKEGELLYEKIFPRMKIHPDFCLQFSPDGKYLFFCRNDELVCLDWLKVETPCSEDLRVFARGLNSFIVMKQ